MTTLSVRIAAPARTAANTQKPPIMSRFLRPSIGRSFMNASRLRERPKQSRERHGIPESGQPVIRSRRSDGILAVSRGLAEAVAGMGVTVNAVLPGPARSEILAMSWRSRRRTKEPPKRKRNRLLKSARPTSLLGRFATTDEVANMIVYTCSEQASATSGVALRVDRGVVPCCGPLPAREIVDCNRKAPSITSRSSAQPQADRRHYLLSESPISANPISPRL